MTGIFELEKVARKLADAVEFDMNGTTGKGGNGGLLSDTTLRAAHEVHAILNRTEPGQWELRYRAGFEDGEKHASDALSEAQARIAGYKYSLEQLATIGICAATFDVLKERRRQREFERWPLEHDDTQTKGQLASAAACYAEHAYNSPHTKHPMWWPWDLSWWKPTDRRRDLVKAGALIIAEIERLDRATSAQQQTKQADSQ